jgi:hypothetical protein
MEGFVLDVRVFRDEFLNALLLKRGGRFGGWAASHDLQVSPFGGNGLSWSKLKPSNVLIWRPREWDTGSLIHSGRLDIASWSSPAIEKYNRDRPRHSFAEIFGYGLLHSDPSTLLVPRLAKLVYQYADRDSTGYSQNKGKYSHPNGGIGSAPRRPIGGCFVLLLAFALLNFAFYIADEPSPPPATRLCYFVVGGLAFICVCQGINLIFGLL